MGKLRIIPRLDIKAPNLIKGIHLEGLRVVGDPHSFALRYYEEGADELIYMDIVASLYERNTIMDLVEETAKNIFVPLTVGGGLRSVHDVEAMLRSGADKVSINTAAIRSPDLITDVAMRFGSQCMVVGIEAKRRKDGGWEAYTDNGREHSGLDVVEWARQAESRGAGELLVTSVDQEGTRKGFDIELCRAVSDAVSIPVIISGGLGKPEHLVDVVTAGRADAVAVADALHYDRYDLSCLRNAATNAGISVRNLDS